MNLCPKTSRIGFDLPGGFAEYIKVPIGNLVPTRLTRESSVLTDAGSSMLHALGKGGLRPGTRTILAGVGGLGTLGVQLAKLMGSEVVALDIQERKLSYALELGADRAINVDGKNPFEVREMLLGEGGKLADVFVDLVGNDYSQRLWPKLLVPGGRVIQVGYSDGSFKNVDLKEFVYGELQVFGSLASTVTDLRKMVELAEDGKVKLSVTNHYKLDEINTAVRDFQENKIVGRAVVLPG